MAILQSLAPRDTDTELRPPRPKLTPITTLLANTRHHLKVFGHRYVCSKCLSGFSVKDPQIRHWLVAKCNKAATHSPSRPSPLHPTHSFHIGNQTVHYSHTLRQHRGLIYCKCCGFLAGRKIHKLSLPCEPPGLYGRNNIKRIGEDRLPYGITSWPSQCLGSSLSLGLVALVAASSSS